MDIYWASVEALDKHGLNIDGLSKAVHFAD